MARIRYSLFLFFSFFLILFVCCAQGQIKERSCCSHWRGAANCIRRIFGLGLLGRVDCFVWHHICSSAARYPLEYPLVVIVPMTEEPCAYTIPPDQDEWLTAQPATHHSLSIAFVSIRIALECSHFNQRKDPPIFWQANTEGQTQNKICL